MKYEVIGWTNYDSADYKEIKSFTTHMQDAIIKELQKNNYDIMGYEHQDETLYCVPVLNSGEKVELSLRSWGDLMSRAKSLSNHSQYDYLDYTVYNRKGLKLPNKVPIKKSEIKNVQDLLDTYTLLLSAEDFTSIENGSKLTRVNLPLSFSKIDPEDIILASSNTKELKLKVISFLKINHCDVIIGQNDFFQHLISLTPDTSNMYSYICFSIIN